MEKVSKYNMELFKKLLNEDINEDINTNEHINTSEDINTNEDINTYEDINEENNRCLITNEKLKNNYIELYCGHKFNYEALYNEVFYQKTRKLLDNAHLKINEIKCPYCRNISNKLLPYYTYYSVKNTRGVTYPEEYCLKIHECEHIKNGKKCTKSGCETENGIFCNKHLIRSKEDEIILKNINEDIFIYYKKKKIIELKKILTLNSCKVSGNKEELINRIIINKNKSVNWLE